jgi:circadian clock protein KaiC
MMAANPVNEEAERPTLPKAATGIQGLDEITRGGLPRGRPTLVFGAAGSGKTLLAMDFLVRGATQIDEPGVNIAFEERAEELTQNIRSLGFDLDELAERKRIALDHVHVERSEIDETGEYDLEGLFVRLGYAIDSIGAKRVVLDTIEALFSGLSNTAVLRAEFRRLLRWLKDKGVTAVITGERGEGTLTRHGLEEYVSDCVILLDNRVREQMATRRLRIVKYRGTAHGTNEYPFLIDEHGISVLPITSVGLEYEASTERISTGIPPLDAMLGGRGYFRGSSILISGTSGTGKTSIAAHLADATARRGERCLYCAFEESPGQLLRNMRSIGLDLEPWVKQGLLWISAARPTEYGLETHLATIHRRVREFQPRVVILDPVSSFVSAGSTSEARAMLIRLFDFFKSQEITALFTDLTSANTALEATQVGVSSLIDTWLLVRDIELSGERNRSMYILKSRGMSHSNQIREFVLTDRGIDLKKVYIGPEGVLTGSARLAQEAREEADALARKQEVERRRRDLERKRAILEARIAALRTEFEAEKEGIEQHLAQEQTQEHRRARDRAEMAQSRRANSDATQAPDGAAQGGHK